MLEIILIILLIVILIVLLQHKSQTSRDLTELKAKFMRLQQQMEKEQPPMERSKPVTLDENLYTQKEEPPAFVPPSPSPEPPLPSFADLAASIADDKVPEEAPSIIGSSTWQEPTFAEIEQKATQKPPEPSFWEKNPDLEKFIGENLFNKIGIAVLVIGIGFFLKFAIDKNWINEIGRTFIGFLCGGILIAIAHRMRKSFAAFSSVLVGGGVAVLYFTVAIAFHQYHLIGQTVAFLLTVLITSFTVLLSIRYNRKELAILAILGGFSAPFMVSTGNANEMVFFSYLLILNIGMLVLAYFKKWNIVNIICYAATILLFSGWLTMEIVEDEQPSYGTGLLFATLYYLVFFAMNIVNNVRNNMRFAGIEIGILLSNTFLYYTAGMLLLHYMGGDTWQGLFTALLAVFNCIFAYVLFRNSRADRTLIFLLIGLVLTFMSLAAPVQLEGNYITLFWSAEAVLIFWLYRKSGIVQMKYASILVLLMMLSSLFMDWAQLYVMHTGILKPVINKAFITGMVAVAAVYLLMMQVKKEEPASHLFPGIPASLVVRVLQMMFIVLLYIVILLELWYQFHTRAAIFTAVVTGCFHFLYIGILLWRARKEHIIVQELLIGAGLLAACIYLIVYNPQIIDIRMLVLTDKLPVIAFASHYVLIALLIFMLMQINKTWQQTHFAQMKPVFNWFTAALVLYLFSAELDHITVLLQWPAQPAETLQHTHRTGYAILWGLYAFALMFLGLRSKSRNLRIISISVFAITLLKLFIFDLAGLGEGGKIAAFISLGILLLLISFMYQRLKKIILTADEEKLD